jgi:hypothetical protein
MKKLIQFALVLVLILGLFQFVGSGPVSSASSLNTQTETVSEVALIPACSTQTKAVFCAMPQVGWNT